MVILIVLLESPKFAGDSAGCHCLGRVPRSAKQHDLYEAAAYTHVTMGSLNVLAASRAFVGRPFGLPDTPLGKGLPLGLVRFLLAISTTC